MATELWARAHCFNEVLSPAVFSIGRQEAKPLFFHEYGRHMGGVPRSSLQGKETQHDDGE